MATITEDYVSFEVARLLKDKGFNEPCYTCYLNKELSHYDYLSTNFELIDDVISAPTLQMVIKWLVQKYGLYVNVVPSVEGYYWTEKWHSYVEELNKRYPFGRFISTLNSPEEACEAAIKYCLENLI